MLKKLYDKYNTPVVRLVARALLAGAAILWVADDPLSTAALVAAGWAALEAFTPLNGLVGIFKK